jgi:hypothetical protein
MADSPNLTKRASLAESTVMKTPSDRAATALRRRIRVRKEDSAFVYFILESYEGITSYSTLEYRTGDAHRDLELTIPVDFLTEVDRLLKRLGDLVYELDAQD